MEAFAKGRLYEAPMIRESFPRTVLAAFQIGR
jgi:hypothetical protein